MGKLFRGHPLDFSHSRSDTTPGLGNQAFASSAALTVLHRASGTRGVVTKQSFVIKKIIDDLWKFNIAIWYDGADPATDTGTADEYFPLASIIGYEMSHQTGSSAQHLIGENYDGASTVSKYNSGRVDSRWFAIGVGGNIWGNAVGIQVRLKYPIPFTNGITIKLVPTNGISSDMWSNCRVRDGLPGWWNSRLRFHVYAAESDVAVRNSGTGWLLGTSGTARINTATGVLTKVDGAGATGAFTNALIGTVISDQNVISGNTDHDLLVTGFIDANNLQLSLVDVAHGVVNNGDLAASQSNPNKRLDFVDSHALINLSSGAGYLVSAFVTALSNVTNRVTASPGNARIYEANSRLFLDGNTEPDMVWTGLEDFAESAFYWDQGVQTPQQWDAGVTCLGTDPPEVSFYRHFDEDFIRFANGVALKIPNLGATGTAGTLTMHATHFATAAVYYGET